jgi:hypothetical protein
LRLAAAFSTLFVAGLTEMPNVSEAPARRLFMTDV